MQEHRKPGPFGEEVKSSPGQASPAAAQQWTGGFTTFRQHAIPLIVLPEAPRRE
jgi:hypothetical protein